MKIFKPLKLLAPALALFSAVTFLACSNNDSSYTWMPDQQTTIDPSQKSVTLINVKGKTIYMTRTNPSNQELKKENSRTAIMTTGAAASASKSMEDFSAAIELDDFVAGFNFDGANDPHKKIYDLAIQNIEASKGAAIFKSETPSVSVTKNYTPGDTETFWALNPTTKSSFTQRTFKLLVSEANYNVWVDTDDKYYTQGIAAFETAAQNLGTNFINGYGLTSHLYGQPSDKIYNKDDSVYGPMATASKTGLKINIMLYDMLTDGKVYGFVYHGDIWHNTTGSNEGRFVYMDSQTTLKAPLEAYSTAQHEFSHTISFNQKTILHGREWTYWYGELLAMMCEDMMQAFLGISDSEVDGNMAHTPKARLPQANALAWANGLSGEESLAYASVFQFGAWLTRNFGGAKFIKELAQNAYVDMESILNAVNAMGETKYTLASLLQKFAGDLLKAEAGKGLLQDAATYPGDAAYTCAYTDAAGQRQTYLYPLTAINLWDYIYAWCDTANYNFSQYCLNLAVPFSSLPAANMYKKGDWKGNPPAVAYLGPFLFKNGGYTANIGPYGSALLYLGTAQSDSVTITFSCKGTAQDIITIYAK